MVWPKLLRHAYYIPLMQNEVMPNLPEAISPRTLFWLWYDRVPLEQKAKAASDFNRFVKRAELEASLHLPCSQVLKSHVHD
jgi:hypothetical protein